MFESVRSLARRHPGAVGRQLTAAYAGAWEALLTAHRREAAAFAESLDTLAREDALDRYFLELPVPRAMQDAVRAGVLMAAVPQPVAAGEEPGAGFWHRLASPRVLARDRETLRDRAALAAARAAEAVAAVHVANALAVEDVIGHMVGPEDAVVQYIRILDLPSSTAQLIYQQALARLAQRELATESSRKVPAAAATTPEPAAPWLRLVGVAG